MMVKKRFEYYRNSQMIIDGMTGKHYHGNKKVCDLLNKESDRADRNVEMFDPWLEVLRKYRIESPQKLDQILFNSRTW